MQEEGGWTRVPPPQITVTGTHFPALPSLPCQLATLHRAHTPALLRSRISSVRYSNWTDLEIDRFSDQQPHLCIFQAMLIHKL